MSWEAIKYIYKIVLIDKGNVEYLGGDKYKLIKYHLNGNKHWKEEYQDGKLHGEYTSWYENGNKRWEIEYKSGQSHGKETYWYKNGQMRWEQEWQNGRLVK